ncbi:MAG: Fic family protein [Proteobacteria bacterium]|nr:Fic family protein [Pseudomonadota bacterium]
MTQPLIKLPASEQLETRAVLKQLVEAHRHLAELKGVAATIPNPEILISTLSLQEAKDSSEIENIFTSQDELFQADIFAEHSKNAAAKEVRRYAAALRSGFEQIRDDRLITINRIVQFHGALMANDAGVRKLPGTVIKNLATGKTVFAPPQDPNEIQSLLTDLERFLNVDAANEVDPLIKMAIAHHQFESIHPFYDGNGRAGRILNSLFLVAKGLLDQPVLYLSGYIIDTKADYYRLLQSTRDTGDWEPWLVYMLKGVATTSQTTVLLIQSIRNLMADYEERIRSELRKIYSYELLTNLFRHPYTKIEAVQNDLGVSRLTASKYLSELNEHGFVEKHRMGKFNYFVNRPLVQIFERKPPRK